ncbi:MAG: CBS domain-containing protein [Lachnospiraceae bacterium]|nr:CBS domain-containing protein [Lachnospiraceae bacterium]
MNYKECFITGEMPIIEAMSLLVKLGTRILLLVDAEEKLLGTLTDSDIRRWIIKTGSVEGTAGEVANRNPKYIHEDEDFTLKELFDHYQVDALPVVDPDMVVTGIEFLYNPKLNQKGVLDLPVVMMAGGKGTRLYPYTQILPKPLIPVNEIPIAERILNEFHSFQCSDFYMIVNYKKEMIKAYFSEVSLPYRVHFVDETTPLGTGGGLRLMKGMLTSTFVLTNCDSMILADYSKMLDYHKKSGNAITFVCSLINYEVPYGIVEFEEGGKITGLREKPSYSFFTNTGMYFVEPVVFDHIRENEKIDFPSIAERCRENGLSVGVYPINSKAWLDMGQFDSMQEMEEQLREQEKI